jgi:hypothetical protein
MPRVAVELLENDFQICTGQPGNKEKLWGPDRDLECIISRVKDVKMEMPASNMLCVSL